MKKTLAILILLGIMIPNFSLGQEQPQASIPEKMEEAKEIGEQAWQLGIRKLPGTVWKIWAENVLPFWQKLWHWFKIKIWDKIGNWLAGEYQKRKEFFKESFGEELKQEKEEMKEELKIEVPSLWQKFKELIK